MAGDPHLNAEAVENWMLANLDRIHFFMPGNRAQVRAALEVYGRGRVGSVFESASIGNSAAGLAATATKAPTTFGA